MADCSGVNGNILDDNGDNEQGACRDSASHTHPLQHSGIWHEISFSSSTFADLDSSLPACLPYIISTC